MKNSTHNNRRTLAAKALLAFILAFSFLNNSSAQIAIIVNNKNSVNNMSQEELKSIFLGKDAFYNNGTPVTICEFVDDKETFCQKLYNFSAKRMSQHWFQKIFSGAAANPPKQFKTKENLLSYVAENEGAIGYITFEHVKSARNVKILMINGVSPNNDNYFFSSIIFRNTDTDLWVTTGNTHQ